MARYIDADRLLQVLETNFSHTGAAATLKQLIDNQPTADVVEVVRCEDCRYFSKGMAIGICRRVKNKPIIPCAYDNFCSYGVKGSD